MANGRKIGTYQISPDCIITEKANVVSTGRGTTGRIYDYYVNDEYVFGVEDRFSLPDLTALYNSGYFDLWLVT